MNFYSSPLLLVFSLFMTYGCSLRTPEYPYAENNVTQNNYFGTIVNDTYQWMEPDSGSIRNKWVAEQKKLTNKYLKRLDSFEDIHKRVEELSQLPDFFVLKVIDNKLYYLKRSYDSRNNILNIMDVNTMENQLVIDPRDIIGNDTFTTSDHSISGNGNYIAFVVTLINGEHKIFVYDIMNSILLPDVINDVNPGNIAWAKNGFYYSITHNTDNPGEETISQRICYHKLGESQASDEIVFENNTDIFSTFFPKTTDKEKMLAIIEKCSEHHGSSLYVKDIKNNGPVIHIIDNCLIERIPVELDPDGLYMITFDNAPKGRFVKVDISKPSVENWETIIPESSRLLTSVTPLDDRFIVTYQDNFNNEAWFFTKEGKKIRQLNIPKTGMSEFFSNKFQDNAFFTYTSATCPKILLEAKKDIQTPIILKLPQNLKFDPRKYISEVILVPVEGKRSVPVNITYKKGVKKDGSAPSVLFCHSEQTAFHSTQFFFTRIFYLEQGYIFAETLEDAEYMNNKNSSKPPMKVKDEVNDFITVARYMINNKITSKEKFCISGREKGATVVMAALMKDPSIANVITVNKGVYDLLRYPNIGNGWGWSKYFGLPADSKEMFEYLYSYSPLHNVKEKTNYPAMIILTEEEDEQVSPAHAYKLAATLQRLSESNNPILLHIAPATSLNNTPDIKSYAKSFADQATFVLKYTNTSFTHQQ